MFPSLLIFFPTLLVFTKIELLHKYFSSVEWHHGTLNTSEFTTANDFDC